MKIKSLQKQIEYVFKNSLFYKNKFKGISLQESTLTLSSLPFTTKSELLLDQKNNPPYGSNLCVELNAIQRIHKTSGTTNTPLILALTKNDIKNTIHIGSKCFNLAGLNKEDVVVHCLNYSMWAGGYTDHHSLEATGATVIPFGVGNTNNLIETILLLKPTAIHCTPSYLKKIELVLKTDFHILPSDLNLKLGLFGAEPGLQNPIFRKRIEDDWGLKAMNANYGLSDVLSMFGTECSLQIGLHFMGEGVLYPELIDVQTNEGITIEEGAIGELVLTNLHKEAQPLIRYKTSDIIKILSTTECDCGEKGFRFEIVGRTDDMLVIRGLNVFMTSVDTVINKFLSSITGVYQFLVSKDDPIEDIVVKIEVNDEVEDKESLKKEIIIEFKEKIYLTPIIEFYKEGDLPRTQGKTKKLLRIL
jgi:phenylacetate-CoA ligase